MSEIGFSFPKKERVTGEIRVKQLFAEGKSFLVYPLKVVYVREASADIPLKVLFSVPKRRFKRANKRNLLKRRMREAYRLRRSSLVEALEHQSQALNVAFTYVANDPLEYAYIERKMVEALDLLQKEVL